MNNLFYTLAFLSLTLLFSCGEDHAELPTDYANVGVPAEDIDGLLLGQWKKYTITRTIYSNGNETTQPMGAYTGDFRFDSPGDSWVDFIVYNFPYNGMFEVRRYGERVTFYQRNNDQHTQLWLDEVSPTKVVFKESQLVHQDYFIVTKYTLTK